MMLMRKLLLVIIAAVTIAAVAVAVRFGAVITAYRHQARDDVARAEALEAELQKLTVGRSDYKAARVIATKFGAIPFENYQDDSCTYGYFESCHYMIPSNRNREMMQELLLRHPSLRHLGLHDWSGSARIYIEHGIVQQYAFMILYKTSDGHSRGLAAEEGETLPKDRDVQARMSNSYSVERNGVLGGRPNDPAFFLESSLTPAATPTERQRAWHFEFSCLSRLQGCGEICEVMPDAWRDFYKQRGHLDVEKYGSAYLFCAKPPT